MGQLFDPDSSPTPTEGQWGARFARAAALIERFEFVPAKGRGEGLGRPVQGSECRCRALSKHRDRSRCREA